MRTHASAHTTNATASLQANQRHCCRASGCWYFIMCSTDPPLMKGVTIHRSWPCTKEVYSGSTLGWLYDFIVCAS